MEEISVKRINIIGGNKQNRMVLSNQERMPSPIIEGKEHKRQVAPAGIIFYDENENEVGGIALSSIDNSDLRAIAFDYANADAIGLFSQDNQRNNDFKAGILINDKDLSGKPGSNISRVKLMTENGNAGLFIYGPDEKPRISLSVDSLGKPSIQVHHENGQIKELSSFWQ